MKKNKAAAKQQLFLNSEKVRELSNDQLTGVAGGVGCTNADTYCTNDSCRLQSLSR